MCTQENCKSRFFNPQVLILLALVLGVLCGFFPIPGQKVVAEGFLQLFTNALKLLSLPVIFLALLTSLTGMERLDHFRWLGSRVLSWTLLTTLLAAAIALGLFVLIKPVTLIVEQSSNLAFESSKVSYWNHLMQLIPTNPFQPFIEQNVIGILVLAAILGLGLMVVPGKEKVHAVLSPVLSALMNIVRWVIAVIPLAVWAGIVVSFEDLTEGSALKELSLYLLVVVGANLLQGFVVIPALLKSRGIAPFPKMRQFLPALSVAFFSKSSVATMPIAIRTAEERLQVPSFVSRFVFPICTTINMNGCAAFILSTVLFVSMASGVAFSTWEMVGWIFIATIAAVGNAGVPMGCFFLSAALLASMNVPLGIMGLILPFYAIIDMIETALNVWSDGAVALLVTEQYKSSKHASKETSFVDELAREDVVTPCEL